MTPGNLRRPRRPLACTLVLAASFLLHGCNSEAAPLWELVDPGGGGAAPVVHRIPDSAYLFVGSDVGGFRYSADAGTQFQVINEGLDFSSSAGDNIQDISSYALGNTIHVIGSATAGMLYWRSIDANGLAPAWIKFFDAERARGRGATTLGALAVDPGGRYLYAGVGNLNNLDLNRLTELDPQRSGLIYVFDVGDGAAEPGPPQADGSLSLTSLCAELEPGPYLHITDLRAVSIDDEEYLYVGTSEGLLIIRKPRSGDEDCRQRLVPERNSYVLSVRQDARNPQDVIVLLNEGRLDLQSNRSSANGRPPGQRSNLEGGLFHTRSVLDPNPGWQDITPREAGGEGLGKLERGRKQAAELVLSGDARSNLGVIFSPDFRRGNWRVVVDGKSVSSIGKGRDFDGWRRYKGSLRGVKEIATDESGDGITTLYIGGFQGMLLTGRRDGNDFRIAQSYTNAVRGPDGIRYRNRGLPLMNPWRAYVNPQHPAQVLFLYHDNIFFVGEEAGASFRRPLEKFGWGTDVAFDPNASRIFVSFSVGNRLEEGRRGRAERGGILVGTRNATAWQELEPRLPAVGPVEALALLGDELCAAVYRRGVLCAPLDNDGDFAWHRAVPKQFEVLHLLDGTDDRTLWLVTARGQARDICRFAGGEPTCSELPVTARDFERVWIDAGRLWLATNGGTSYSSALQLPLDWDPVDTEITDLRTVRLGQERVAVIASGAEGLFASRTPMRRDSWCQLPSDGLNGNRVIEAVDDPAGGDYLYVAVAGVGFYRASLDSLAGAVSRHCLP